MPLAVPPGLLIVGTQGPDVLTGGDGDDTIFGDRGDDTLFGGDGNDSLDGGLWSDAVYGGAGNDTIIAGAGNETAFGGDGDDLIILSGLIDARDLIVGGTGSDTISAAAGTTLTLTRFDMGPGGNITGIERIGLGAVTVQGTNADDYINFADTAGSVGPIRGLNGNDTITGTGGADRIDGGSGNDVVHGMGGNDTIHAGNGSDSALGGDGDDRILLSGLIDAGDLFDGGAGMDTLAADAGLTTLAVAWLDFGASGNVRGIETVDLAGVTLEGTNAGDRINLADRAMTVGPILGRNGNDTLAGSAGGDTIDGGSGNDTIEGHGGNDVVAGGTGNDRIDGGTGNDTITGGLGVDTLTGGLGNDAFVFTTLADTGTTAATADVIADFDLSGNDTLILSGNGLAYRGTLAFSGTRAEVRVADDGAGGTMVLIDANGDGIADRFIALRNTPLATMGADDFIL